MRVLSVWVAVALLACACGAGDDEGSAADCAAAVRYQGTTYTEIAAFIDRSGPPLGSAQDAACDDMGPEARGAYFPANPRAVKVWSVRDREPRTVLATRSGGSFRVYVADDIPRSRVSAIRRSLIRGEGRP